MLQVLFLHVHWTVTYSFHLISIPNIVFLVCLLFLNFFFELVTYLNFQKTCEKWVCNGAISAKQFCANVKRRRILSFQYVLKTLPVYREQWVATIRFIRINFSDNDLQIIRSEGGLGGGGYTLWYLNYFVWYNVETWTINSRWQIMVGLYHSVHLINL